MKNLNEMTSNYRSRSSLTARVLYRSLEHSFFCLLWGQETAEDFEENLLMMLGLSKSQLVLLNIQAWPADHVVAGWDVAPLSSAPARQSYSFSPGSASCWWVPISFSEAKPWYLSWRQTCLLWALRWQWFVQDRYLSIVVGLRQCQVIVQRAVSQSPQSNSYPFS